jgi:gluconokinase
MQAGTPLTDADRAGWLDALSSQLGGHEGVVVLTCSALKRAYRDRLRQAQPAVGFVHLRLSRDEAWRRVSARAAEHLFPASLVDSQFATLESPQGEPRVLELDATRPLQDLLNEVTAWSRGQAPTEATP